MYPSLFAFGAAPQLAGEDVDPAWNVLAPLQMYSQPGSCGDHSFLLPKQATTCNLDPFKAPKADESMQHEPFRAGSCNHRGLLKFAGSPAFWVKKRPGELSKLVPPTRCVTQATLFYPPGGSHELNPHVTVFLPNVL